ncbi:MAG: hypothetical protein LUE27_06830 [Clostridia bacterium]|nr:hypothetical protein [Clostridia bacterium]
MNPDEQREVRYMEYGITDVLLSIVNSAIDDTLKHYDTSSDVWNEYWEWLIRLKDAIRKSL